MLTSLSAAPAADVSHYSIMNKAITSKTTKWQMHLDEN